MNSYIRKYILNLENIIFRAHVLILVLHKYNELNFLFEIDSEDSIES